MSKTKIIGLTMLIIGIVLISSVFAVFIEVNYPDYYKECEWFLRTGTVLLCGGIVFMSVKVKEE